MFEVGADDRGAAINDRNGDRHHAHFDHFVLCALIGVNVFDLELEIFTGEMILHLCARASASAAVDDNLLLFCHTKSLASDWLDENSLVLSPAILVGAGATMACTLVAPVSVRTLGDDAG